MKQFFLEYGGIILLAVLLFVSKTLEFLNLKNKPQVRYFSHPIIPFIFPSGLIIFSFTDYYMRTEFLGFFAMVGLLFEVLDWLLGKVIKRKYNDFAIENNDDKEQHT